MAQNEKNICQYISSEIFDNIPYNNITFTRETFPLENPSNTIGLKSSQKSTHECKERKFIIDAPIGSGKSSAVCKWISLATTTRASLSESKTVSNDCRFILIVPTINIASEFYNKIYNDFILLNNNTEENKINDLQKQDPNSVCEYLTLCIKDGAFEEFKQAFTKKVKIIITTYSTASHCLGSLVEYTYHNSPSYKNDGFNIDLDNYTLIIDEAHLLLNNIPLIEIIRDFNNVGLLSATIDDISGLSVFKDYRIIKPNVKTEYNRNIFIHQLDKNKYDTTREEIIELIKKEKPNYDKIVIKIEDKNEGMILKNVISESNMLESNKQLTCKARASKGVKVAIHNGDRKEVSIDENGKIYDVLNKNNIIDVVIATSTIQAGQSLKENILQIFIQTPLDTISSVEQFIGRNRLNNSTTHLFLKIADTENRKFKVRQSLNRYEYRLNQLRANTWFNMSIDSWRKVLNKLGKINVIPSQGNTSLLTPLKNTTLLVNTCDAVVELNPTVENNHCLSKESQKKKKLAKNSTSAPHTDINICEEDKEFKGLKKLYKYYGFKIPPDNYKIIMTKPMINNKRVRMYKLVKDKTIDENTNCNQCLSKQRNTVGQVNTNNNSLAQIDAATNIIAPSEMEPQAKLEEYQNNKARYANKELNIVFKGKKSLYKFYDINECPSGYIIQTKTLNENGKRTRAYWLTNI